MHFAVCIQIQAVTNVFHGKKRFLIINDPIYMTDVCLCCVFQLYDKINSRPQATSKTPPTDAVNRALEV